jgi:putative DNA methylase
VTLTISRQLVKDSWLRSGKLPVEELAAIGMREGRRPRPVYLIHKWFARRFGSAFRALLVAAITSKEQDFWKAYLGGVDLKGLTVADPFVGGGTSIMEAQRLGANCFASDVDPIAASITQFQSRLSDVPDLRELLKELKARIGSRLKRYYVTRDRNGRPRTVLHYFWVQTIDCGKCHTRFDAHPHHQLAHEASSNRQWAVCAHCGEIGETALHCKLLACRNCRKRTRIGTGTVTHGLAKCPQCGFPEKLIDVAARSKSRPTFRLFALEYLDGPVIEGRPVPTARRLFKRATTGDLARYAEASRRLRALLRASDKDLLPKRIIPVGGRSDDRLSRYGYKRYTDLFNDRQLLHLAELSTDLKKLKSAAAREAASIAFCDHLKTNCMMTSYAFGWRRLAPLFAIRAFRHVTRPVELNPWLDGTGRGTFPNAIRRIESAKAWLAAPSEPAVAGGFHKLTKLPSQGSVAVTVCSAHKLSHIPNASVDLFVTDPPYFDNIAYSELSDFFVPWHASLGLLERVGRGFPAERLDAKRGDLKKASVFETRLAKCLRQIARKLKTGGLLVFTYQHKTAEGWCALASALARSRMSTITVFPILGDSDAGPHKHDDSIHWDAVIVAQPKSRPFAPTKIGKSAKLWADDQFSYWTERLQHSKGAEFTVVDQLNLRRACYAAALSHPTNQQGGVYDVAELMKQTAQSALPRTDLRAATNEKSNLPIHQNRVPQAVWSGSLA